MIDFPQDVAGIPADIKKSRTRVLLADDNRPLTRVMTWAMESYGHDVRTCANGLEAVILARTFHPDVVVMDIGMPVMDGLEACQVMRREPDMRDTLIIAQTAWGDDNMRRWTREAGFDVHLVKPVDLEDIERLVAGGRRPA